MNCVTSAVVVTIFFEWRHFDGAPFSHLAQKKRKLSRVFEWMPPLLTVARSILISNFWIACCQSCIEVTRSFPPVIWQNSEGSLGIGIPNLARLRTSNWNSHWELNSDVQSINIVAIEFRGETRDGPECKGERNVPEKINGFGVSQDWATYSRDSQQIPETYFECFEPRGR